VSYKGRKSGFSVERIGDQVLAGRGLRQFVEVQLDIGDRQARASISSWSVEGWMVRDENGRPAAAANSVDYRCALQFAARYDSRRENGRLGGRPKKNP
jgi:hypothetical protein